MRRFLLSLTFFVFATLACGSAPTIPSTLEDSAFDDGRAAYGFFPSPPEVSLESVLSNYKEMRRHGDFVLIQQNTNWDDFVSDVDGESQTRTDIINQVKLAHQNGLDTIFVIDALNGLNRSEFAGLPAGWDANFANPHVRAAYKNFALWVLRNFHPRYLGLASEINTYMDAYPEDAQHFISLYNEIYALIKAESPETQVFVTFQWDGLNNMFPQPEEGDRKKFDINWEQVEAFEPNLDLWVISTYPYFVFPAGADIPTDYYSPLPFRTSKPVAIAEGGFSTQPIGGRTLTDEDQLAYLNAVHDQLGPRMAFWVNTLFQDLNMQSYAAEMESSGRAPKDAEALSNFAFIGLQNFDGSPKPSLALWDSFRK